MFANAFTWLGLVILLVIVGCYVGVYFMGKKLSFEIGRASCRERVSTTV